MAVVSRPCDVTVFGCTGNAGRGVAFHVLRSALLKIAKKNDATTSSSSNRNDDQRPERKLLRVGLAGRNRSKVESTLKGLKEELARSNNKDRDGNNIGTSDNINALDVTILVADADDSSSMKSMAESSTVVVSCAGPYGRYGEPCVKACIESGTHYLDITGEVPWITKMIQKYGPDAEKAGVTLLPFSGYDCVPAELAMILSNDALVYQGQQQNQQSGSSKTMMLGELNLAFGGKGGGFPRGTLNTILDGFDGKGTDDTSKQQRSEEENQKEEKFYPKEYGSTMKGTLSARSFLLPKWSGHIGQFTGPNFMAAVNTPVLCRSSAAIIGSSGSSNSNNYYDNNPLIISDRSIVSGPPRWLNGYGLFPSQLYISALVLSGIAILLPPVRSFLRNKLATYSFPGNPDGNVVVKAEGIPSLSSSSTTIKSKMKMVVPGDPGIYATGLFAAAVADTLLEVVDSSAGGDDNNSKSYLPSGFHPPVAAFHAVTGSSDGGGTGLLVRNLCRLGADINLELIDEGSTAEQTATKVLDPVTIKSK